MNTKLYVAKCFKKATRNLGVIYKKKEKTQGLNCICSFLLGGKINTFKSTMNVSKKKFFCCLILEQIKMFFF